MAEPNYKEYLAVKVLTESQPVTYRLLSRALKVNVNIAKRMLFDFHAKQNAKRPKSVHASYLIAGTKRPDKPGNGPHGRDDDDTIMQSSPFMSSMPEPYFPLEEPIRKTYIVLVREEELEKARAEFSEEVSIHIYSLEPGPIENLHVLSACNRKIDTQYAKEDPLQRWKTYGSIQNSYIKRRTAKYAPPANTAHTTEPAAKPTTKPKVETKPPLARAESTGSGTSTPQPAVVPAALRRSDSSSSLKKDKKVANDIFKSFAKAKSKPKEPAPAAVEDDPMQGMSEDEGDTEDEPEVKVDEEKNEAARKAKAERAEKLRKMMEDDDEDMPDATTTAGSPDDPTSVTTPDTAEGPEPEPTVVVENGRRRGRRKVMKKKKVKDEDGYLVTKEEAMWESFSEDEPQPKKLKPSAPSSATGKAKAGGKKAQGSIASFFKKP